MIRRNKPPSPEAAATQLNDVAYAYLIALRRGQTDEAKKLIRRRTRTTADLESTYLSILEPVQKHVGSLWVAGEITMAEEHFMTMATQELIEEFCPLVFTESRHGISALVVTPPGELHDMGARMVADLLESDGFDTRFVSCPQDNEHVLDSLYNEQFDLVALSVTAARNVAAAEDLLSALRQAAVSPPKVMIGGQAAALLRRHGDAQVAPAADGAQAVRLARSLFGLDRLEAAG